jgi:hypothetical protein
MRGILPEYVRRRVGKGSGEGIASRSLKMEKDFAARLLKGSMLAQLGIVDTEVLRAAVIAADHGNIRDGSVSAAVQATLDVEMWLRVRSGRWGPDSGDQTQAATSPDQVAGHFITV